MAEAASRYPPPSVPARPAPAAPPPPPAAAGLRAAVQPPAAARQRVLILDPDGEFAANLARAARREGDPDFVYLADAHDLPSAISQQGPFDALIAGPTEASADALARLVALREHDADLGLVMTVNGHEPADLDAFVSARPDRVVRLPAPGDALRDAVTSTLARAAARRAATARAAAAPAAPVLGNARVIAVSGPTGGSGKTMLAINLAYLLARQVGPDGASPVVVLVDLDVQFGEVSAALQLRPAHSLYEALYDEHDRPYSAAATAEVLADCLVTTPGGFAVLAAPADPSHADAIGAEQVAQLLAAVTSRADFVVVDTPTGLRDVALAALDRADHVIAVTQVDVPGIANVKTYLETLDRLGIEGDRRTLVLNKDLPDTGVSAADAQQVLGQAASAIPFDAAVTRALNSGRPLTASDPGHPVAHAVRRALAPVLGDEAVAARGSRFRLGRRR